MPCISGFGTGVFDQYYAGSSLDIAPVSGWFAGAVVSIANPPLVTAPIAHNGKTTNQGWTLEVLNMGGTPGSVAFRMTVFDGTGIAAQATTASFTLNNVGTVFDQVLFTVLAGFSPPSGANPNGAIAIVAVGSIVGSVFPLATSYLNKSPRLFVGVTGGVDALSRPNCLLGLIGGTAQWNDATMFGDLLSTAQAWEDAVRYQQLFEAVPSTFEPTLVNTNGWRPPSDLAPGAAEPSPLAPIVGADSLVYANNTGGALTQQWVSSEVFYPDNNAAF